MPALIGGVILLGLLVAYWYVAAALLLGYLAYRLTRHVLKERYFASEPFLAHRRELVAVVQEHNDVAQYASELRAKPTFAIGESQTGAHAHLASWDNTSRHNYRRDRNIANLQARNVHNCSLQVVRNASGDPIKYLMKYFNIRADEPTLAEVEALGESLSRLESAVENLRKREAAITTSFAPPRFITKHYHQEFLQRVGVELPAIDVPYPVYSFEYVSAGGNSGQKTTITLDSRTTDALIETLGQKIRFAKSAVGQRALMTAKLRNHIKQRDNFTCQNRQCGISVAREPHLLLEVDHIHPVSKGGLSTPGNLRTLCWRCNRSKSDKILA